MSTGEHLKRARGRLRLTQQQLAEQVGVSRRTVAEWETSPELPAAVEGRLSAVLTFGGNDQADGSPLADVSDMELVAEMARRLAYLRAHQPEASTGDPHQDSLLNAIADADTQRGVTEQMRSVEIHPGAPPVRGRETGRTP